MQIILFEALYLHVDSLGGWGIAEMRVFLGVLFLVDAFQMVLFAHNFDVFSEKIVHRDLSLSIFYSTRLIFCTVALLMTRAEHFHELYFTFFKMGQRPDHLYGPGIRYIILLIIPVGMIASFPTRVLVDPTDSWTLPALLAVAAGSLLIANFFWRWSVKRYMTIG
jgi:ABC-type uncharacterized transport system permease subunit